MKRLVLCVEGEGEVAAPALVGRLLAEVPDPLQGQLFLDNAPLRVGGIHQLTGRRQPDFLRHLRNAAVRKQLGAVLLLLDGDADAVEQHPFCPVAHARLLADRARGAGAGTAFSFGAVFTRQEYESLLIAGADQLPGLKPGVSLPTAVEDAPRDAKGWLHTHLTEGYSPVTHQAELTRAIRDWVPLRAMRSFRRLEHAIAELAEAVATGHHVVSPSAPPPLA